MESFLNFGKKKPAANAPETNTAAAAVAESGDYEVIPGGVNILGKLSELNTVELMAKMIEINQMFATAQKTQDLNEKCVSIRKYAEIYIHWTQMMEHFGSALSYAFSDSKEKA